MDVVFSGLKKKYGDVTVYDGFDLKCESGQTTAIMGKSGCGKTTLLNIAAGLVRPDGGSVTDVECSYVFQSPRLLPNLKARAQLTYAGASEARADELMRIIDVPNVYPKAMSGGMAQRVNLARAFIAPQVVLMDEPFKSLDIGLKYRLMTVTKQLVADTHATVLFVTHDPDEASFLADRAIVIDGGKIIYDKQKSAETFDGLLQTLQEL